MRAAERGRQRVQHRRWSELFGAPPDGPEVRFTYHVNGWTMLLLPCCGPSSPPRCRARPASLEEGLFAAPKTRAITRRVDALCRELRPHAAELVDGFGTPDANLDAAIAGA